MSTMARNGIAVDTTYNRRKQQRIERTAKEIAFENKVKEFHAKDSGMKPVKTAKVHYAEFYHAKRGEWLVTPYETLAEIAHLENEGYVQKKGVDSKTTYC